MPDGTHTVPSHGNSREAQPSQPARDSKFIVLYAGDGNLPVEFNSTALGFRFHLATRETATRFDCEMDAVVAAARSGIRSYQVVNENNI